MTDLASALHQEGIRVSSMAPGRFYTTCPQCSKKRKGAHQRIKVLGVTVDHDGARWGCNHCGWTGATGKANSRANGAADPNIYYDYVDETGELLFQKVRGPNKKFWQRKPDGAGGWINKLGDTRKVIYRLPQVNEAIASGYTVTVVEGEKDVDNLWKIGVPATCNPDGASETGKKPKWRREYSEMLRDADLVVIGDHDDAGRAHVEATASMSLGIAARVRVLDLKKHWPACPKGGDISDWLAVGHTREEFDQLVEQARNHDGAAKADRGASQSQPTKNTTLREVIATFERWLTLRDHTPIYAVLGTVAANLLPGDPVWLGIIAPPSSAKTEILNALLRLPYVNPTATLTPAALLSGTPKRQRDKNTEGGLLRKIDEFGILVLKDFGSILSMRPEAKAEILAALREIYDGSWTRHLGTDGGKTLTWSGKVGLIFGATEAYDDHHSVIGSLGDRFLLCRLPSAHNLRMALNHTGTATKVMRDELATAVARLFSSTIPAPPALSEEEIQRLEDVVSLAVLLRAHVNRDRHSREIESVHGAEGPGRMGLALERLLAGLTAIGVDRKQAVTIIEDVALASTPPIRRHAFELLTEDPTATRMIAQALKLPTTTARRALEELCAHGLAVRSRAIDQSGEEKQGGADLWHVDPQWRSWHSRWAETKKDVPVPAKSLN